MKILNKNTLLGLLIGINVALMGVINLSKGIQAITKEAKQVQAQIIQEQELGILTKEKLEIAANLSRNCSKEINFAIDEIEKKNWSSALEHTINAKDYLAKLKALGIPIEKYKQNIDSARNLLYAAFSGEVTFT